MFRRHPLLSVFTFGYLAVVAWVTLGPQPLDSKGQGVLHQVLRLFHRHASTQWITYDRVEFTANIAMFVPIGLFLLLLFGRRRWWLAILVGFAMTVSIETAQLFLPGRVSDVRDIVSNTIGATIGVLLALALTTAKARRLRRAQVAGRQSRPVRA